MNRRLAPYIQIFAICMAVALLTCAGKAWGGECKTPIEEPIFKVWADKSFPEMSGGSDFPMIKCVVVAEWQGHISNCPRQSISLGALCTYAVVALNRDGWELVSAYREPGICLGSDVCCVRRAWLCFKKVGRLEVVE